MTQDMAQLLLFGLTILALTPLMGRYMARLYAGEPVILTPLVAPLERLVYRIAGIDPSARQRWTRYALSAIALNFAAALGAYIVLRMQHLLPLNPRGFGAVPPPLAFNTAISFITGTGRQAYAGEVTLSYLSQMAGCTLLSFIGTATAMAVAIAVMRGFVASQTKTLGNFHQDFLRGLLYVLLPISLIAALFLIFEGVPQTLGDYTAVTTLEGAPQTIPQGPVATQTAIKMLGAAGGGFFNANSAHPYENPTPLADFAQTVLMLLIPAALTYTFGLMAGDTRQGWALFSAMAVLFALGLFVVYLAERSGNSLLGALPVDQAAGNLEGKEVRFGIAASALWAVTATATASGAANAMLDSFTPMGGAVAILNLQLREAVFGGAGSGFYTIILYAVLAVFIAGLMTGRSAHYLGKQVALREIQLTVLALLMVPLGMLLLPAVAIMIPSAIAALRDRGPHGLSDILYAYASATVAGGSDGDGVMAASPSHLAMMGLAMLVGRFAFIIVGLAIAGSVAGKRTAVALTGTARTTTPLFVALLVAVILLLGALSFFPAIALGPLAEHFEMLRGRSF